MDFDLLSLLVEEALELPSLWCLLVQPHIRKFLLGLETLRLHVWKLLSDSSAWLAFRGRLQRSSVQTLEDQRHLSARSSSLDSSIGVMD